MERPTEIYAATLGELAREGNLRRVPECGAGAGAVDLSSNDYLGLADRVELQAEFMARAENRCVPLTSSASRLLCGRQGEYGELEGLLKELYGRETLLFNSGYHANTGLVSALGGVPGTLILADKLVHASMIDGIVLSRAPFARFRHNDVGHLERLIEKEKGKYRRVLVLTESVFSMDGDRAPLEALADVKRRHPEVVLYVDEAHAFGALGRMGLGLCRESADYEMFDVVMGTFGKACASMGAFAALSPELREFAVNKSRSFIFSTALPPLQAAWTKFLIEKIVGMDSEREHLRLLGERLGLATGLAAGHIVPVMAGSPGRALELSGRLLERGFKVLAIRVPTVPPGTDRLRVSLSASLDFEQIDRFAETLKDILQ